MNYIWHFANEYFYQVSDTTLMLQQNVKMEVNIDLHFLNIGDLQYNIHLFKTRI